MPVQPDSRRFAIVSDLASYLPTTQKGAVNGLATLGADGKVPSAQLPAGTMMTAYKTADDVRQNTAVLAADTHLTIPAVPVGTWWLELEGNLFANPSQVNAAVAIGGSAVFTTLTLAANLGLSTPVTIANSATIANIAAALAPGSVFRLSGPLPVTTAGTVALYWAQQTSSSTAISLRAGSRMKLTRLL